MSNLETERQQIRWVRDAISKGYDWPTLEKVLRDEKNSNEMIKEVKEMFIEESLDRDKLKLSFFEKRKVKKTLKDADKKLKIVIANLEYLKSVMKDKEYIEDENLIAQKREMIDAMFGVPDEGKQGMLEIFHATDEQGNEIFISREEVERMDIDEVIEMFEDLVYEFGRNI